MKRPHHAKHVFALTLGIVMFIYAGFGTFGYLVYGENIQASITLNLVTSQVSAFM